MWSPSKTVELYNYLIIKINLMNDTMLICEELTTVSFLKIEKRPKLLLSYFYTVDH